MKYHHVKKFWLAFLLMPLLASRASALVVTDYSAVTNNRFAPEGDYTNTIANPAYVPTLNTNAAFIGYGYDFSGVGWDTQATNNYFQYGVTLISPRQVLMASHADPFGNKGFFGRDGQVLTVASSSYVDLGNDVRIRTLNTGISASQATVYPVLDLGSNPANYVGSPLIMYGWYSKVGTNYITGADSTTFNYSPSLSAPGMAYVQGGDSSSPDFIPYLDPITGARKLSVLGAHQAFSVDPLLPGYWTNINAVMNPTGYSLKWAAPVAQTWTGGAGSGDFTNSVNWSSAMPGISNAVLFDVGAAGGQTVINLGGTQTLNGLYFKNSGGNGFTISNGLLAVDRVGIVNGSNGALVIQSDVAFNAPQNWDGGNGGIIVNGTIINNGQLFYLEGTGTNRLNGVMYGAGGLAKDGSGRLIVGGTNVLGGSIFVHAGTLELASPYVNSAGSLNVEGSILLQEGTNIFGGSLIDAVGGLTASVLMTGGLLVTTNSAGNVSTYVGNSGVGVMTVSNGTWLANRVSVGESGGSAGTLILAGGTNVFSGSIYGAFQIGDGFNNATGTVLMTGGQLTIAAGALYVGNAGVGVMTVSNGTLLGGDSYVAVGGGSRSTLNIAGGTNVFSNFMDVGHFAGATGAVNVTGGNLAVTNTGGTARLVVGASGVGALTLSGGTLTADQLLATNGASSSFTFNGGALNTRLALIGAGSVLTVSNNGSAQVGGVITNAGTMTVLDSRVIYQNDVVNQGAYVSDPSTNSFNANFTAGPTATVSAAAGDVYAFGANFVLQSTNRAFDVHLAQVVFTATNFALGINSGITNHTIDLTGSGAFDMGANILSITSMSTNFGIGTLSLAPGNRLTLNGAKASVTNALYVGCLDLGGSTNNITLELALNVNMYYDRNDPNNAYLVGQTYSLGTGELIPIPEPSALVMMLAASALPMCVLKRKGREGMIGRIRGFVRGAPSSSRAGISASPIFRRGPLVRHAPRVGGGVQPDTRAACAPPNFPSHREAPRQISEVRDYPMLIKWVRLETLIHYKKKKF